MTHSHRTIKAVDCRNQKGGQIRIFQDEYPYAHVADVLASGPHPASDARRFVAAWNACRRIPTEALEAGVVQKMLEALEAAWRIFDHGTANMTIDEWDDAWDDAYGKVQDALAAAHGEEVT